MLYPILTDLVVFSHLLFIIFVVAGGFFALHRWWLAILHLPAALWGVYIEFSGTICPLTPLENHFRRLAGQNSYATGFIDHYLLPIIYPAGLTREIQFFFGLAVIVVNVIAYGFLLRRYWRRRWPTSLG